MAETIPALLREQAAVFPQRDALVDADQRLTFAQFDEQALRVCRAAIASGIKRGDHVAIVAPNSASYLVLMSGLLAAGAAVVPINTRFKGAEIATALEQSRATVLFTVSEFLGVDYVQMIRDTSAGLSDFPMVTLDDGRTDDPAVSGWTAFLDGAEQVSETAALERLASVEPADTAYVILTSGTTGTPKGVRLSHAANLGCSRSLIFSYQLRDGERTFLVLPFFHIFGLNGGYLVGLLTGGCNVIASVFDPVQIMEIIQREQITLLPGPPTIHQGILDSPQRADYDLSSLRTAFVASTALPASLVHRIVDEELAPCVVTGYGLTEAGGTVALTRAGETAEQVAEWAGTLLPDVELKVMDSEGNELPHGQPGEFWVRSATLMDGYVGDPEATAEAIDADGWLHTGDVGLTDGNGRVRCTDRKKDMFIVGGFNAYPAEIEGIFARHPGIAQVAVVGMPDARMGEVGAAFVVASDPDLNPDDLIAWAREHMANYKVPRHVELVAGFAMTPSFKILKGPLRERAREIAAGVGAG